MSETNNMSSKMKTLFSPIANLKSIKEFGSSVSRNASSAKEGVGSSHRKLQRMFSFNISGSFSNFILSCLSIYLVYWIIKKALNRMEYSNTKEFIRYCVDFWICIMFFLIIFSSIIQLL